MSDDNAKHFRTLTDHIRRVSEENIALQAVCAALIAEICVLKDDPKKELDRITTSLSGAAMGLALHAKESGQMDSNGVTNAIERICEMANRVLR